MDRALYRAGAVTAVAGAVLWSAPALADPLSLFFQPRPVQAIAYAPETPAAYAIEPPSADIEVPGHLRRQLVNYRTSEAPGTIVIDTPNTYLYYVLGGGQAIRYGIGVGRDGFTWSGVQSVSRKSEWPDWIPPEEMLRRQPYLPRFVAGGLGNPLGARAMYLGNSQFRIHGTNQPQTIGKRVSSGCIRMLNEDVTDLYARVEMGTKVVVLPDMRQRISANEPLANAEAPRSLRGVY